MGKSDNGNLHKSFGAPDFIWRWVAALVLVLITFNPFGYSYFHWFKEAFTADGTGAIHYFVGVVLLIGWSVFVIATSNSLGAFGTIMGVALIGTGFWLLADFGIINADSTTAITWLVLVAIATLLAIGVSWSHVRRRFTGQVDVDDIGD
jgi:hypothetical protein